MTNVVEQVKEQIAEENKLATDVAAYAEQVKEFRSKCLAADNARTPYARRTFALLLSGAISPKYVVQTLLATFGNPTTPKGKALDKITSSSADYVTGFGTARKTAVLVLELWDCALVDDKIRAMLDEFSKMPMDCYKKETSLTALDRRVCDHIKANIPVPAPEQEDASQSEQDEPKQDEPKQDASANDPASATIADNIKAINDMIALVGFNTLDTDVQESLVAMANAILAKAMPATSEDIAALAEKLAA